MDLRIQIIIALVLLIILIAFTIKRNRYVNFLVGFILLTSWMIVTISLPFIVLLTFKLEAIVLFLLIFGIYMLYLIRSNFFIESELSHLTNDSNLINMDKAIRIQLKAVYLTIINTVVILVLIVAGVGIISISPLILLCSSVWAIPLAIIGVVTGFLVFGILMIGLIPSIIVNIVFSINGTIMIVNSLGFQKNKKVKHILFTLIPLFGIYDGIKLIYHAKRSIEAKGFKWHISTYKVVEISESNNT